MKSYIRVLWFFLGLLFAGSAAAQTTPEMKDKAAKLTAGAYVWTGLDWKPMERLNMSGGGLKHAGKIFVPGLTPQMVWTFHGAHALTQVNETRPLFCYKFLPTLAGTPYAPNGRDIVIVHFDEKKDRRELQTTNGGNMFTFKAGLSKERMK